MVNHWLCHCGQYLWWHRSWTRDAEILHGYGSAWFHLRYGDSFSFLDSHVTLSLPIYVCCYYFVTLHMRGGNLAAAQYLSNKEKRGGGHGRAATRPPSP